MLKIFISILFLLLSLNAAAFGPLIGGAPSSGSGELLVGDNTSYTGGNSTIGNERDYIFGVHSTTARHLAVKSGYIANGYIRINATDATDDLKICVYLDTGAAGCSDGPCNLVGCSNELNGVTAGVDELAFAANTYYITAGNYYIISAIPKTGDYISISHNNDDGIWQYDDAGSFSSPPDPWVYQSGATGFGDVTIYVTN